MVFFPIELSFYSKNRAKLRNKRHCSRSREPKKNYQIILGIICWGFATFQEFFGSPQVQRNLISSIKKVIYELLKNLKLINLEN